MNEIVVIIIGLVVPKGDSAIVLEDFKNTNFKEINFN